MIGYILILILFALLAAPFLLDGEPLAVRKGWGAYGSLHLVCADQRQHFSRSGSGGDWYSAFLLTGAAFP